MSFAKAFIKTAAHAPRKIINAVLKRELMVNKALNKALAGKEHSVGKFSQTARKLRAFYGGKRPLSAQMVERFGERGVDLDKSFYRGGDVLGVTRERMKVLAKQYRKPGDVLKDLREEARTKERRKKSYADEWAKMREALTSSINKKTKRKKS